VGCGGAGRINSRIPVASPWREAGSPWWTVGWLNEPAPSGREPVVQLISGEKWESADKPGSVEGNHPSGTRVAARLERPTRKLLRAAGAGSVARAFPYLVLLQVGFAVPPNVATGAVRSYRTLSPLPSPHCCDAWAVCSLLHFPWARAPQALPGTLPCGARTFLCQWRSGCLADSRADYTGAVRSRSARS
jgi:hypothetical protein